MNWTAIVVLVVVNCLLVGSLRLAVIEMRDALNDRNSHRVRAADAEQQAIHLEYALAKEQREHRLLLKNRERKRNAGPVILDHGVSGIAGEERERYTLAEKYGDDDSATSARRGRG